MLYSFGRFLPLQDRTTKPNTQQAGCRLMAKFHTGGGSSTCPALAHVATASGKYGVAHY